MQLVIELLDDNGNPLTQHAAELALATMLRDPEELYGCLELCDMEGRALLARVVGRLEGVTATGPYDITEMDLLTPEATVLATRSMPRLGDLLTP